MNDPDLATLVANAKAAGKHSYDSLAAACGGVPARQRLYQIVHEPLKNFPDPNTIRGLARGCKASVVQVIHASARSLGLAVGNEDSDLVYLPGFGRLPIEAQESIRSLARQMFEISGEERGGNVSTAPMNQPGQSPGATKTRIREQAPAKPKYAHPDDEVIGELG